MQFLVALSRFSETKARELMQSIEGPAAGYLRVLARGQRGGSGVGALLLSMGQPTHRGTRHAFEYEKCTQH